jgi:hypothetical protein
MNGDMGLPARARALAARQDGVLTRQQAAELGVPGADLRRLVRQGRWVRLGRGCYWVAADGGSPRLRTRVRGALLTCGPGAVAYGPTAVRLHGLHGVPSAADRTVHVACPHSARPRQGVTLHRLGRRRVVEWRGLPMTTVTQSVADVLRTEDRATAVSVLDSALHLGLLPGGALNELYDALHGYPGGARARGLLKVADGRAESPLETRGRLVCTDARMPPEVLQWELRDADGVRRRVDLGWPGRGVGVEADGRTVHDLPEALYADRHRQNALLAAHPGLVLLRFTWRDTLEPDRFLETLRHTLRVRSQGNPAEGGGVVTGHGEWREG